MASTHHASSDRPHPEVQVFDPALRRLAIVVVLGAIMTMLDSTIVNVAITALGRDFHAPLATVQWVLTGYTLALAMTVPITSWAIERFGGRTLWITSLVLFVTGSVLCSAAWSIGSLIAFRVLQGVGGGLLMPVGQTMLARAAGPDRMGRVMSVIAVPAMLAPVLGPVFGGVIVDRLAWRWMFGVNVPVCVLALVLAVRLLPRDDTDRNPDRRFDRRGLALLSPGLVALVYGLSRAGGGAGVGSADVLGAVAVGLLLVATFTVHALRTTGQPLLDVRLFLRRSFASTVVATFFSAAGTSGLVVLLPLYVQVARGRSPLAAGLLMAPVGLGAVLTMPISGRAADRYGSRPPALAGTAILVLGALACTRLGAGTGFAALATVVFVIGLGHGLIIPALSAGGYRDLPRSEVPAGTTMATIASRLASAVGTAALAVVLQNYLRADAAAAGGTLAATHSTHGGGPATPGLAPAFAHSFWWAAALAATAAIPLLFVPGRARTADNSAAADLSSAARPTR